MEPEAPTKQLYLTILQSAASREPGARRPAPLAMGRATPPAADAPLVGRQTELTRLRQRLQAAWRGAGQVILVTGEAGIGKSRLVEELGAAATARGTRMLVGRAFETEQILPFRPWVDALRAGQALREIREAPAVSSSRRSELARLFPELGGGDAPPPITREGHLQPLREPRCRARRAGPKPAPARRPRGPALGRRDEHAALRLRGPPSRRAPDPARGVRARRGSRGGAHPHAPRRRAGGAAARGPRRPRRAVGLGHGRARARARPGRQPRHRPRRHRRPRVGVERGQPLRHRGDDARAARGTPARRSRRRAAAPRAGDDRGAARPAHAPGRRSWPAWPRCSRARSSFPSCSARPG